MNFLRGEYEANTNRQSSNSGYAKPEKTVKGICFLGLETERALGRAEPMRARLVNAGAGDFNKAPLSS